MINFSRFSRLIRQKRRRRHETQGDVAARLDVSQQLVSRMEAGRCNWEQFVQLARALGLGLEIRLGGQAERVVYPLDPRERREIEANIDWLSRLPPVERLRTIALHVDAANRLRKLGRDER